MDEIYVATDIETDGPSPGQYSMLSFASVAFRLDKFVIGTFQRNLELLPGARQDPKVMKFWQDNPDAWAACRSDPVPPKDAMNDYAAWLAGLGAKPVLVAHPVGFDYTFIHWYLHEFTGGSPLFPAGLDIASYAMAVMGTPFTKSHKPYMPSEWIDPNLPHTHKAIDDAMGHAMLFCNMVAASQGRRTTGGS
jgi:DNA polymerase III alpha subunit (gram-positive type)